MIEIKIVYRYLDHIMIWLMKNETKHAIMKKRD